MRSGMLLRVAPVLAGIALWTGCEPAEDQALETPEGMEVIEEEAGATDRMGVEAGSQTIEFQPGPAGSNVAGTLTITEAGGTGDATADATAATGGGVQFTVELTGLTPGEHAWHIHNAACGQEGPVVVPFTDTEEQQGIAEPVVAGDDGRATVVATVPANQFSMEQIRDGQYSVHVHERGGTDHGQTVACADLSAVTVGTMSPVTPPPVDTGARQR